VAKVRLLDPNDSKRRLDRYELIGELASGGMATVFLGRLGGVGGFQRFVAIKRLHPHLASEEEFIEMFLDEARLAAGIHHPHVVPILEVGESDSGYYLVMEYVEGDTLARLMARSLARAQPIPRPVLIRIVLDALAGLHAAHELLDPDGQPVHLVHRDVSPQNVLVGVDGCSRITDFGVAHAASRLQNTRADRLKGKLAYMSPEQARAGQVDRRADVFAMGVILWEVLAAKRLFKAESEAITLQRVTVDPIPRLSAFVPELHPAIEEVVDKALERNRDRRYRTAADMAEALERAARAAANASATDLGVASPREVAAYVQGALGEDIAAQRESVRAWLAHSEPSMPRSSGVRPSESGPGGGYPHTPGRLGPPPGHDVTMKMPLDRAVALASRHLPPTPPLAPRASSAPAVPPSTPPPVSTTAPSAQAPSVREALGLHVDGSSLDETPVEPVDDDEDEHETLLMDRDEAVAELMRRKALPAKRAPAAQPRPFVEEGTPSASMESFMVPAPPPPNRMPQLVALGVGLLIAVGGVVTWLLVSSEHGTPSTIAAPGADHDGGSVQAPEHAAPTPPAPVVETPPTPAVAPGTLVSAVDAGPIRIKGPMPKGKPTSAPAATVAPVIATIPASPPLPPAEPPPKPPDDMDNPYKKP
jgi:eukaryotic-like serine/threonine-protein kinase